MLWFFLNLLLLGTILFLIFNFNFRPDPRSRVLGGAANRLETVSRLIVSETDEKTREERDAIMERYSEAYNVQFYLFDFQGNQLGGRPVTLPSEVYTEITRPENFPQRQQNNTNAAREPRGLPPPGPPPSIYFKTQNPTLYWVGQRTMTFNIGGAEPVRTRLLAASDSYSGHGLFFDPTPWIIVAGVIIIVSFALWFPFVRNITGSVKQITRATEKIADEEFDVRVGEKRTDELGRLGKAINHLAARLSGFVGGQKRFLGDISHELNSPLARMQFALSILEDRVPDENRPYVEDVKEEVELMSKLVSELLSYSKAGIKAAVVELERIPLLPLVENVIARETAAEQANIEVEIDPHIEVLGQPELLSRAIANVVRNAIEHAGSGIVINAANSGGRVKIGITDHGSGVPEDALEKIFDPLYRVESDRSRQTGGTGLGLAIVKTCVEACGGRVHAENIEPSGLAVNITLKS
jgi:two-component system, OmpR family, sensor histidine kinase CpxA